MTGRAVGGSYHETTLFYENDPVGTLSNTGNHGVEDVERSDAAWGDYDNDGDLDLAMTGNVYGDPYSRVYRNDGDGVFTNVAELAWSTYCSAAWGDYDNDGDLDVVLCGNVFPDSVHTRIYENTGSGFVLAFSPPGLGNGSLTWIDVDLDGDLDLFQSGCLHGGSVGYSRLYENVGGTPNIAPAAPTQLNSQSTACGLQLSWSGAADAETPTAGLYYCLRVGTSSGAHDIVSGTYGSPLMGNVSQATGLALTVPAGTYYWSVRTVDSGLMASPWSAEQVAVADFLDTDGDGVADLYDVCPADPLDKCDPDGSTAEEVAADEGGTVETPDGQLTIEVEPDDLAEDAIISVTQTVPQDPEADLMVGPNPGLGQAIAVYAFEPDGQTFASPVTLTIQVDVTDLNTNQRDRLTLYHFEDTDGDGAEDAFVAIDGAVCTIVEDPPDSGTFIATCTAELEEFCVFAVLAPLDSDNDGLPDLFPVAEGAPPYDEAAYSTSPSNPDTDGDGLLDGTEVDVALGNESDCPDPREPDSDGDTLSDGDEVGLGTAPCDPDTDGDGAPDNWDPDPLNPGAPCDNLEQMIRDMADGISNMDLALFSGPNDNANEGRRNALANRATAAANIASHCCAGEPGCSLNGAINSLEALLDKIDGDTPTPDWMYDSPEKTALANEVSFLITLLEYEL